MTSIEVLGDRDTVLAFRLGGVRGRAVETADEARAAMDAAVAAVQREGGFVRRPMLLLVTHGVAERVREYLHQFMLDPAGPLVIEIPGLGESTTKRPVEDFVARVLGVHL